MKHIIIFIILTVALFSCGSIEGPQISGKLSDTTVEELFVCEITNNHYDRKRIIDTIAVQAGQFSYSVDSVPPQMLFIGISKNVGGKVLWDGMALELEGNLIADDQIKWQDINKSSVHNKYREYEENLYEKSNQAVVDSFGIAFQAARKQNSREEMARIKEESMPFHNNKNRIKRELINEAITINAKNSLGLHLFYAHNFENASFSTIEEINEMRDSIASFNISPDISFYARKAEIQLKKFEKCAVGMPAPEVAGYGRNGEIVKLSDLKGQYVLVDFWSSGCGWCRKESPSLIKAYNAFKDKDFTILGASSDTRKDSWLRAIKEDKTGRWDHLIFDKNETRKIMDDYCIKGIPHIILINPKGEIIAKDLRGEDIYNTIKEYVL